jgi:hypothetical protein
MWPTKFKDHYGSIVWQDNLWETLFNIKHIQNKRRKPNEGIIIKGILFLNKV